METSAVSTKSSSNFESAFLPTQASDLEIVSAKVRFIKHLSNDRVMLLIERNNATQKVYTFARVVAGERAPFRAELLVEQRTIDGVEYWNVTTVTNLDKE